MNLIVWHFFGVCVVAFAFKRHMLEALLLQIYTKIWWRMKVALLCGILNVHHARITANIHKTGDAWCIRES